VTTPPRDDGPIFEAEEAPPTVWEQVVAALRPRRSTTPVHPKAPRPQGAKNVSIAMGKSLVGAVGGVLFMLGVLGVSMSALLVVGLVATKIQNLSMGISWVVSPVSLVIFGALGGIGYALLRSVGMFSRRRRHIPR
jgi:hypothetical protein